MSIVVQVKGTKEARKLLRDLSGRELQNRTRRATRAGAAVMRDEVRAQARSRPEIPDFFAKTRTRGHRNPLGTSTGPSSRLINVFEGGAGSHQIGAPGQMLHSQQGEVPVFAARGPVPHPGMEARPLIGPAFGESKDEASEKAMTELVAGIR